MAEAMARLWAKFLPEMEQRVALVAAAARALAAGNLMEEERAAGHAAAHKLAGSLGLFGMTRGTEIARELEQLLEGEPHDPSRLAEGVSELETMIAARSQAGRLL
jgi:HPt (histidine-containing phosphotransfer) domain-containing protein